MRQNNFDIIVLGTNIGALISASLLCKNGYRVLVVENAPKDAKVSKLFDEDASVFVSGCAPNRLLYNIFRELSVPVHQQKKFKVQDLSYQVATPGCRLDVGSSWNLYSQEIKREFCNDIGDIEKVYNEVSKCDRILSDVFYNHLLHPQTLSARLKSAFVMHLENIFKINEESRGLSEIELHDFKNKRFNDMLRLQMYTLSRSSNNDSNMTNLFLLGTFLRGIVQEPGKFTLLTKILKDKIKVFHGEFISVDGIESIQVSKRNPIKDKKGIVIKFKNEKRAVESKFLIYGQALFALPKILEGIKLTSSFQKLVQDFYPESAKLTFSYRIDGWGIPVGFKSRVMFIPDGRDNSGRRNGKRSPEILVTISPENSEFAGSDEETRFLLKATVREPFSDGTIKVARVKELFTEVTESLKELIAFYDDFVTPVDTEFSDINLSNLNDGDFLFDSSFLKNLSLGEVISCEILKNIYFSGKEFLPQLGFEGEILSGWRTANMIASRLKLHKMY